MSRGIIYLVVALFGAGLLAVFVVDNRPDPEPLPPNVTAEQAATYANSARRTEFNRSKPGTYEWKAPGEGKTDK